MEREPQLDPAATEPGPPLSHHSPSPTPQKRQPFTTIGAFTVQCAGCFKWRVVPTKEIYEEIREHLLRRPFYCEAAGEWRPGGVSCDDPADIIQDGSRLWAIDKPSIARPPPGWQRLLRIRGQGSTKFADVYYVAPSGKTLRSLVEVQKYLSEHPEFMREGISLERFSFQTPRPLEENYVRKRTRIAPGDNAIPIEAKPLNWISSADAELQPGRAETPQPESADATLDNHFAPPLKKQAKISPREAHDDESVINHSEGEGTDDL